MKNFYKRLLWVVVLLIYPVSSFGFCSGLIFDSPQVILSDIPFSPPKNSWLLDPRNRKQTIDISGTGINSNELFIIADINAARINTISVMFAKGVKELTREGIMSDPEMVDRFLPLLAKWSTHNGYKKAIELILQKAWRSTAGRCVSDWELDSESNFSVSLYIFIPHHNKKFPAELDRIYQYRLKFVKPDPASIYLLDDAQPIKPARARLAAR